MINNPEDSGEVWDGVNQQTNTKMPGSKLLPFKSYSSFFLANSTWTNNLYFS